MTSEQKRRLQALAAKYERHGISFVDILQMLSVNAGDTFDVSFNTVRLYLGQRCGEEEDFSLEELAAMNDSDVETVRAWAVEHGIPILKVIYPDFGGVGGGKT